MNAVVKRSRHYISAGGSRFCSDGNFSEACRLHIRQYIGRRFFKAFASFHAEVEADDIDDRVDIRFTELLNFGLRIPAACFFTVCDQIYDRISDHRR